MSITLLPCGLMGELRLYVDQEDASARLRAASGVLGSERKVVAQYLAAGSVIFAMMDCPPDLLDPRASIPGGSGVQTDGENSGSRSRRTTSAGMGLRCRRSSSRRP